MAYAFPVFVDSTLKSTTVMGIIMATSSLAGITCDLVFPRILKRQTWKKHLLATILVAGSFPLLSLLGIQTSLALFFIAASVIWGIYYELLFFSQQHFVVSKIPKPEYSKTWSTIAIISSFSLIGGPILAAQLVEKPHILFLVVGGFQVVALLIAFLIGNTKPAENSTATHISFLGELRTWWKLAPQLFPVIIVGVLTKSVDAAFWTIGSLFGEHFFSQVTHLGPITLDHTFTWLPLIMYQIPSVLGSFLLVKLGVTVHKKYISEMMLMLAGVSLVPFFFLGHSLLIMLLIFVAGFGIALATPLNQAVYSDLIKRAHGYGEDVVGLAQANASLAYIVTPFLVGFSVEKIGYTLTFSILGTVLLVCSALLLLVTPKKIRMPKEI